MYVVDYVRRKRTRVNGSSKRANGPFHAQFVAAIVAAISSMPVAECANEIAVCGAAGQPDQRIIVVRLNGILIVAISMFAIGMITGWRLAKPEVKVQRTVLTQSPATYKWWWAQERFAPLGDREHGAWIERG